MAHPRIMKIGYHRGAPAAWQRRYSLVPRVRPEFDVGASGTPHCCPEHAEQTRDRDAPPGGGDIGSGGGGAMERVIERCCGLDVHKKTVAACVRVPGPNGARTQHVQTFGTTTARAPGVAGLAGGPRGDARGHGEHGRVLEAGVLRARGGVHLLVGQRRPHRARSRAGRRTCRIVSGSRSCWSMGSYGGASCRRHRFASCGTSRAIARR